MRLSVQVFNLQVFTLLNLKPNEPSPPLVPRNRRRSPWPAGADSFSHPSAAGAISALDDPIRARSDPAEAGAASPARLDHPHTANGGGGSGGVCVRKAAVWRE